MDKKVKHMEELIEKSLDAVTSSPAFLSAVSLLINANSYRKIWIKKTLEAMWKDLELPGREDQLRLLKTAEELNLRLKRLELAEKKAKSTANPEPVKKINSSQPSRTQRQTHKHVAQPQDFV